MSYRLRVIAIIVLIFVAGIIGCLYPNDSGKQVVQTWFTNQNIATTIQHLDQNHVVNDINVVGIQNARSQGFAFASFRLDGQTKYASLYANATSRGMGTFSVSQKTAQGSRFVYSTQISQDGTLQIFGVVVDASSVTKVLFTFPNGNVVTAPVSNHLFWYVGNTGTSHKPKEVVGITSDGAIVNQTP